jgi:hypothetical protein
MIKIDRVKNFTVFIMDSNLYVNEEIEIINKPSIEFIIRVLFGKSIIKIYI